MAVKHCLDLCSGTGGFSSAFADADGWDVTTVDVKPEFEPDVVADVMDLQPSDLPESEVVVASPPCPEFSFAGNHDHWENRRPIHNSARDAVAVARHVQALAETLGTYWFIENPKGRLAWIFGPPTGVVHYCAFGKPYKKPTYLWGSHPTGMEYPKCPGDECDHASNTAIQSLPPGIERAAVPRGLSQLILDAVERRAEQSSLVAGEWP